MRYLLDTHTFIWWVEDSDRLSKSVRTIIEENEQVYISAASTWEIIIKSQIGKIQLSEDLPTFLLNQIEINNFQILSVRVKHTLMINNLPMFHKDPFDRMLISQAIVEDLTLLTCDGLISKYDVQTVW